jgi:hypothetical protein
MELLLLLSLHKKIEDISVAVRRKIFNCNSPSAAACHQKHFILENGNCNKISVKTNSRNFIP